MDISRIDSYKDGGTIQLTTSEGINYCIDWRLRTETKGKIYHGYPKKDNSNIIENQEEIKEAILESMVRLDYHRWSDRVKELLES